MSRPRRGHEHVAAALEPLELAVVALAADDGHHLLARLGCHGARHLVDLLGELAGGGDDQGAWAGGGLLFGAPVLPGFLRCGGFGGRWGCRWLRGGFRLLLKGRLPPFDDLQHRQGEGGRLACAGLGRRHDVAPGEHQGYGLRLDGGWG